MYLFFDSVEHVNNYLDSSTYHLPLSHWALVILCAWRPRKPKDNVKSPGTRVTSDYESPCGYWKMNPGLAQEQQVLLTDERSLQAPNCISL